MNISRDILTAALAAFKIERQKLDENIAEVEALLGGNANATNVPTAAKRGRGKRSAAVRARMGRAQKERWAKLKDESTPEPAKPAKTKRKMSAAGRKAIAAAQKTRWAAKKKATE